jgi:glycosyltransferase involved in cell wall biosynthesis
MKKIVVCMAVYNEEKAISMAIQAIFKQKRTSPDKLLIVASGCTDHTIPIIESYIQNGLPIHLIIEKERLGKAKALNSIFAYLRTEEFSCTTRLLSLRISLQTIVLYP